jgi:hypothetical protein
VQTGPLNANGRDALDWDVLSPQEKPSEVPPEESDVVVDTRPTPARVKERWIEEKRKAQDTESPPVSLLQESTILSEGAANNTSLPSIHISRSDTESVETEADENYDQSSHYAIVPVDEGSMTQLSKVSFQLSTDTAMAMPKAMTSPIIEELQRGPYTPVPLTNSAALVLRDTAKRDNRSDFAQLEKIEELERSLKEQQFSTGQTQLRLKERVVELEQALRATAATPRGTIIQENPLKTLLDRNQTLVKEVRFADSTCVELSAKVSALEAEKQILKNQIVTLETENKEIRRDYEHALVGSVSRNDDDTKMSFSSIGMTNETGDEGVLRKEQNELKAEMSGIG